MLIRSHCWLIKPWTRQQGNPGKKKITILNSASELIPLSKYTFYGTISLDLQDQGETYHENFIHVEFPPRAPIIVFCIDGKTQEKDINNHFINGQEAVSNQEWKEADNDEWQHPDGVISLVIQQHNPSQTCTADNQDLKKKTVDNSNARSLLIFFVLLWFDLIFLTYMLLALPGLELRGYRFLW